jgi:hypothetical protein
VLRSISQSFARIAELLGLIVETTLATLTENSSAHADQLYKLVPLKDGLAVTQQSILEVRGSSHIVISTLPRAERRLARAFKDLLESHLLVISHLLWDCLGRLLTCWEGCWAMMRTCLGCCSRRGQSFKVRFSINIKRMMIRALGHIPSPCLKCQSHF